MPLERAGATVRLDRSRPGEPVLTYELEMHGPLTDEQRQQLVAAAASLPGGQDPDRRLSVRPG